MPPWQCSHCAGLFGVGETGWYRIPNDIKPLWPLFSWLEAKRFGFHAYSLFYVYAICYPSGLPFYVGKGQADRVCQHVEETWTLSKSRWSEKHGVIISLADRNESEWYHFLGLVKTESEAFGIEQRYVQRWGLRSRGGMLTNRVEPKASSYRGRLPSAPKGTDSILTSKNPRTVHHPELLIGGGSGTRIDENCVVCGGRCSIPVDFFVKVVQCPYCAHFWTPGTKKQRSEPIEFRVPNEKFSNILHGDFRGMQCDDCGQ